MPHLVVNYIKAGQSVHPLLLVHLHSMQATHLVVLATLAQFINFSEQETHKKRS